MDESTSQSNNELATLKRAIHLLNQLYEGMNPLTGDRLPDISPYQNPDIVRSLRLGVESLTVTLKRKEKNTFPRTGKSWEPSEDAQLCQEFAESQSFEKMAKEHARSRGAILARLEKLGKVQRTFDRFPPYAGRNST